MDISNLLEGASAALGIGAILTSVTKRRVLPWYKRRRTELVDAAKAEVRTEVVADVTAEMGKVASELKRELAQGLTGWASDLAKTEATITEIVTTSHAELTSRLDRVTKELTTNHGSSLKDSVNRMEARVKDIAEAGERTAFSTGEQLTGIEFQIAGLDTKIDAVREMNVTTAKRVDRIEGGAVHA